MATASHLTHGNRLRAEKRVARLYLGYALRPPECAGGRCGQSPCQIVGHVAAGFNVRKRISARAVAAIASRYDRAAHRTRSSVLLVGPGFRCWCIARSRYSVVSCKRFLAACASSRRR